MSIFTLHKPDLREAMRDPLVRRAFRDDMWYQGDLSWCLRHHGQSWIYNWIKEEYERNPGPAPFVVETHRRLGKSFMALNFIEERLIPTPGLRAVYATPTKEEALGIVPNNIARLNATMPHELKPKSSKFNYLFKNPRWPKGSMPSEMNIFGVNHNPNAARGAFCDVLVVDEAGYIKDLEFFMNEVMIWQFQKRERPFILMISTPPKSMDHPFITKYVPEAMATGRHMVVPASRNPDFTKEDERIVLQLCGSKHSVAWKREAECEHISDPESLIVPEWQEVRTSSLAAFQPPAYFFPLIVVDTGWSDYTHALFCYVDFEQQKFCVLDEIWTHYKSAGQIVEAIKSKERRVFDPMQVALVDRIRRVADADMLTLRSFYLDYGMQFEPAQRHDSDETLARLRTLVQRGKVLIHPRCKQLVYQLDNGIWNDKRTDFIRSSMLGHCDGIKALAYGVRQAEWDKNPFPREAHSRERFYRQDRTVFSRKKKSKNPIARFFSR